MNYKLALKLKENGFPQPEYVKIADSLGIKSGNIGHIVGRSDNEEIVHYPTLSELIDACGEEFISLEYIKDGGLDYNERLWWASGKDNGQSGETPEEAVANLWIKLNGKTI